MQILRNPFWLCLLLLVWWGGSPVHSFYMHKIMAAALLANSMQMRSNFLPLPIPVPIPIKVGGNTIIALQSQDGGTTFLPLNSGGGGGNCLQPPCQNNYGKSRMSSRLFWGRR